MSRSLLYHKRRHPLRCCCRDLTRTGPIQALRYFRPQSGVHIADRFGNEGQCSSQSNEPTTSLLRAPPPAFRRNGLHAINASTLESEAERDVDKTEASPDVPFSSDLSFYHQHCPFVSPSSDHHLYLVVTSLHHAPCTPTYPPNDSFEPRSLPWASQCTPMTQPTFRRDRRVVTS